MRRHQANKRKCPECSCKTGNAAPAVPDLVGFATAPSGRLSSCKVGGHGSAQKMKKKGTRHGEEGLVWKRLRGGHKRWG